MSSTQSWIPLARVQEIAEIEPAILLLGLSLGAWAIYKLFLRNVSKERHARLNNLGKNLVFHLLGGLILFGIYQALITKTIFPHSGASPRIAAYVGFAAIASGTIIFVKVSRILLFEYLFLSHMRVGVPLLIVNLFTLVLSLVLSGWIATDVFGVRLTPLLATSAILSLVLGLALQDTLGNLFAGIALQFDKPFEIGDWVEIQHEGQKWIGEVREVSWRATVLLAFGEELVTIPNRIVGQAQVSNFAARERPFVRRQTFRLPYGSPVDAAKQAMVLSALATAGVRKEPLPLAMVSELAESWIEFRLIYFIDDYATQYIIADRVIQSVLAGLQRIGVSLASPRMHIELSNPTGSRPLQQHN
ncbi:MAG: hypothetical protein A2X94_16505 [Bdellovibrionales bacterium GWB1_55_8]|nr:MAG: hypothetical protein A2X94_16505 [Bdellovibrionales bacterium GWB1_55_8]